jgi:RNA 2',3'-cyclic 3'-phosphodiesterase
MEGEIEGNEIGHSTAGRRVFIGIPVVDEIKLEVIKYRNHKDDLSVRWINPDYLHITVIPPWQCSDIILVCKIMSEVAASFHEMEVEFTAVSSGPDKKHPHLIWTKGTAPKELVVLKDELSKRLEIKEKEKRDFILHLTIARFRFENERKIKMKIKEEAVKWKTKVDKLYLYESILDKNGAVYKIICESYLKKG